MNEDNVEQVEEAFFRFNSSFKKPLKQLSFYLINIHID